MSSRTEATVWRALANPQRRRILDLLREGPRTTGDLSARFAKLSRFAVMQHLGVLEDARLVLVERSGRERFNHLNVAPVQAIYDRWVSKYARPVAAAGMALKNFVEGDPVMSDGKKVENTWATVRVDVEIPIDASAAKVWERMTVDVSKWWPISFCADPKRAKSFHWEMKIGGRMYEDWGAGNGWLWWTIYKLDAVNRVLCASGNMGGGGMLTEIQFKVEPEGEVSKLRITEIVSGAIGDAAKLEAGQVKGWKELFEDGFKAWLEKRA